MEIVGLLPFVPIASEDEDLDGPARFVEED
jgi:hypothetical protein